MNAVQLLVIDPQNDFCDLPYESLPPDAAGAPGARLHPALPVSGAHADMLRLANFVRTATPMLDAITVTLDSHHHVGIERPTFWRDNEGASVGAFTPITAAQVRAGLYAPRVAANRARALAYLDALEAAGRYALMVWPAHCEIGTWGHAIHASLHAALNAWEEAHGEPVHKVLKGSNPWTEHYSALMAEVPLDDDPHTQLNRALVSRLAASGLLVVAGEAGSHCVKATVEHLIDRLPAAQAARVVLLTDCMSPVAGFEAQYEDFLVAMRARGVRTLDSAVLLREFRENASGGRR